MSKEEPTKKMIFLFGALILASSFVFSFQITNGSKTLIVPNDYLTISGAIQNANPRDTIFVKSGVYFENLVIDKSLSLIGENPSNTIIIGEGNVERGEQTVVTLSANQIEITGFTIKSQNYSKSSLHATGISVEADNCKIANNIICNTYYGIFCSVQSNITISKNQIMSNLKDGIRFVGGSLNNISENNIEENAKGGIAIEGYSNIISKNNITNNDRGIGIGSSYSLIFGNNIEDNIEFNFFFAGSHNIVCSNNISDSTWGIYFSPYFAAPIQNKFYHNNFINNLEHVGGISPYNIQLWDAGFPLGGNYWNDYKTRYPEAKEINDSGIGNTHYEIDNNNTDNNPLLFPHNIQGKEMPSLKSPLMEQDGIVAHWPFDEVKTNGVTPDKTGLNHAVVGTSSGDYSFTPILVDGKFNKSLSFDGAAYVNTPILPHLEIPDETTIDVWINAQQFKNVKYNNIIVECARTRTQLPERTFGLAINGLKKEEDPRILQGAILAFTSTKSEGLNEIATTESVINLNEWIHVVFTRNLSSGMHIYVNGKEQEVTVISGVQNPKGQIERETELYIGHDAVCLIDELQLYNIAIEPNNNQYFWIELILIFSTISGVGLFFYFKVKH